MKYSCKWSKVCAVPAFEKNGRLNRKDRERYCLADAESCSKVGETVKEYQKEKLMLLNRRQNYRIVN